jgi:hypothetical protein
MEYKVHFSLTIHSVDGSKAVFFGKEMLLPFVPFLGLQLREELGPSEPVKSVTWSPLDQKFFCHIDSYEVEVSDGYNVDLAFLIIQAKANGWQGDGRIHTVGSY